jgi:hypothetical protein
MSIIVAGRTYCTDQAIINVHILVSDNLDVDIFKLDKMPVKDKKKQLHWYCCYKRSKCDELTWHASQKILLAK